MLSISRAVYMVVIAVTTGLAPSLAWADPRDPVVVTPGYGWVDTNVSDNGADGASTKPVSSGSRGSADSGPRCTYTPDDGARAGGRAPVVFTAHANMESGQGQWYSKICDDGTVEMVWVPNGSPAPGRGQVVTAAQLAQRAYNRLQLPMPEVGFNPRRSSSAGAATLVTIPTWFWVEDWSGASQRTRAGVVWAEVTAEPVSTEWYPGDGSGPVLCAGAGVAWRPGMDESGSSCKYTYPRSSANRPGNRYVGRVVVTWRVTWTGSGGAGGTLPLMSREREFPIAVMERQTVVVTGQGSGS